MPPVAGAIDRAARTERLAGESAAFGQPEVNLGIIPGFGGTQRLPRLVGPAKALEMNLTGDPITAEQAYEFGLVNRVVPDHELFDTALAWARKIAGQAPLSVQRIKRLATDPTLDQGIESAILQAVPEIRQVVDVTDHAAGESPYYQPA